MSTLSPELIMLARARGIQTSYVDMAGALRQTAPATVEALVKCWPEMEADREGGSLEVEPVVVVWTPRPGRLHFQTRGKIGRCKLTIRLEHGEELSIDLKDCLVKADQAGGHRVEVPLPELPVGYHEARLLAGNREKRALLISAPRRLYAGKGLREWGLFLPMYAAHGAKSWGAGTLREWKELGEWMHSLGGTVLSTLPLLASFLDQPVCDPSPYSPASRLFWNEFYVDLTAAPEFKSDRAAQRLAASPQFQSRVRHLRRSAMVEYGEEFKLRRRLLAKLSRAFFRSSGPRRGRFEEFLRSRPELEDYAEFRAVCDSRKESWQVWPERMRNGVIRSSDYEVADKQRHLYAQWLAQEQMNETLEGFRARDVKFYLDLPLGVHPDGFDTWRERASFELRCSAGAPPDPYFTKGQDWGFSPLHPERIRRDQYRYARRYLGFIMRHTGMLRIDHVMGLHRLYWIPRGFSAAQGAYVSYRPEEWYAILSVESHRNKTMLVGENLGTVPPEVNEWMDQCQMRKMYVLQYELKAEKNAAADPPRRVVASVNTHDMPPFAAFWKGLDIQDRADLGLISPAAMRGVRAERQKLKSALRSFLIRKKLLEPGAVRGISVLDAALQFLSSSEAEFLLINLEDLWLETRPQNVPSTWQERPNWRRKTRLSLEELRKHNKIRNLLRLIDRLRRAGRVDLSRPGTAKADLSRRSLAKAD